MVVFSVFMRSSKKVEWMLYCLGLDVLSFNSDVLVFVNAFMVCVCVIDALLTTPVKRDATTLPSVNELKGKIMIKHKKLPDTNSEVFTIREEEGKVSDMIVSSVVKGGGRGSCPWM